MNAFSRTPGQWPRLSSVRLALLPVVWLVLPTVAVEAGDLHAWLGRHLGSWGCWCQAGCRDFGGTGCGPRYWGAFREDPQCVDPCDGCSRWKGCNGARQLPDVLAPWQLPPGRGFMAPESIDWHAGPCQACGPGSSAAPCGSCEPCGGGHHRDSRPWRPVFSDIRPRVWEWWPR